MVVLIMMGEVVAGSGPGVGLYGHMSHTTSTAHVLSAYPSNPRYLDECDLKVDDENYPLLVDT